MVNLTNNAVAMLYNKEVPDGFEPWLQVIDTKKIKPASGTGGDRYRYDRPPWALCGCNAW